jgi:hypothetical protein
LKIANLQLLAAAMLGVAAGGAALETPPLPPEPKAPHRSAAVSQGAGAAALIVRKAVVLPPALFTNHLWLIWDAPVNDNLNLIWVVWDCARQVDLTNYFEVQAQTNGAGDWAVWGVTNKSPWPIVATNSCLYFRLRSFLQ